MGMEEMYEEVLKIREKERERANRTTHFRWTRAQTKGKAARKEN